jgi:hypothetical protein
MRNLILSSLLLASLPASASILVTVSPIAGGTRIEAVQTAANPSLTLDQFTSGFVAGIPFSGAAFDQDVGASAFTGNFSDPLGTLSNSFDLASSPVAALSFYDENLGFGPAFYRPLLTVTAPLILSSSATHQLSFVSAGAADVTFDFTHFIEGTYVDTHPLYGTITTVVIPEPSTCALAVGAVVLGIRRRRNA